MMLMRARASGVPVIAQSSTLIDKYTGTNTATIGTHQIGDYFVAYASRDGSSTAPTVPGGWTTISSGGANALGYALAWKIAASTSETAGTFTNATSLIIVHERTSSGWTPTIGAFANNASGSGVSPAIPALTLQNTDNTSRVIAFYASVAADITGLTTPPSGMEYIGQTQDATDTSSAYRTTSTVSSWSSAATSFSGTTGAVRATAVEIKLTYSTGAAPEAPSSLVATAVSSTQINLTWVDNSNTETGFVVERSADGSTGWSVITTTAANATSYNNTGLSESTTYYYRVKAANGYGESSYTSTASDTTSASDEFLIGWDNTPVSGDLFFDAAAANDSGTGTEASPYKTITLSRLQSLVAGQRAWFKSGSYNFIQAITGLASGTASDRITLAAYPGHTPTFIGSPNATDMDVQCAIGNVAYWDFRNLTVSAVTWGILVGPRQWNLAECPVNHVRFIGCTLTKTQTGSTYGDNSGCLFVDSQSDYIDVAYCSFTGAGSTAFNNNALLWIDRIPHFKCVGNVFDNCNSLLYYKHNHQLASNQVEVVVKNNIFSRATTRTNLLCVNYMTYTGNAHYQCSADVSDDGGDGSAYSRTGIVSNNTFLDSDVLIYKSGTVTPDSWMLRNNLFLGTSQLHDNPDNQSSGQDFNTNTDFNAYTTGNAIKRNGITRTLAAHKTAFTDQEQNSPAGSNNTINASGSQLLAAYWQLTAGNAIGGGQDGVNCGADYINLLTNN